MDFLKDKNGLYNLRDVSVVTANKDGFAVLHMNGGEYTTATKYDDLVVQTGAEEAASPAKDPAAK